MANPIARSMTGFAQKTFELDGFSISITLKSLNSKGLDISFKAPLDIMVLEPFIRDYVKSYVKRGTISIFIDVKQNYLKDKNLNHLKCIIEEIKDFRTNVGLNISDDKLFDLAMGIYSSTKPMEKDTLEVIKSYFEEVFKDFIKTKEKEGGYLIKDISFRVELLEKYLRQAIDYFKDYENVSKQKLIQKAKELSLDEASPLVVNELMFVLGRLDISEELTRIQNHINHLLDIIKLDDIEKGKKIDFLTQELNREITTMSNKVPELSNLSINMKYETDKIKQQCANLE